MTTAPRPRFSVRLGLSQTVDEAPYDGVPEHLLEPLRQWVGNNFTEYDPDATALCLQLRMPVGTNTTARSRLISTNDWELLDVVDAILGYTGEDGWDGRDKDRTLARLLDIAGSAYQVNEDGDGLEERITPAVRDAVSQTVTDSEAKPNAGSAAEHLSTAWRTAYGLHPDPVRAYSEAIKAVECAAHSVIQPNDGRATLGTMLGEIRNARPKFRTALSTPASGDPIAPVEAMMRALWDGQTSRHGKQTVTVPETLEAARAGVHLAAALVQWFASGAVARTP
ncbi:hypothetical protein MHW47_07080 [Streptomyces sp. OfavH-34-F]|uniref:hypothetical protein n=1 Tax=Streptomyces sp. OfavH-34-F TaxID=2917760 RepID=UPI001EF21325|nr:hypothetical protein [Streptomyces sp. OfavH-34-F]MCG7524207.1 hypothetical protein [Streptomyces sp. OfavH-34-F]